MVPVVISILLVVLMSGAVLKVVADDHPEPTRPDPPAPPHLPIPPPRVRRPATSQRRAAPPPVVIPVSTAFERTVRLSGPPLPRHRARSGFLLIVLVFTVGTVVAIVIGAVLAALAFALRAAVTS